MAGGPSEKLFLTQHNLMIWKDLECLHLSEANFAIGNTLCQVHLEYTVLLMDYWYGNFHRTSAAWLLLKPRSDHFPGT